MADKKVSDTLKQQRKANKEFLELKKMQSGEMDPGAKPSEVEIKPKTFWEKVQNIWYNDKTAIIIGTLLAALFIFFTVECATKVKPDLQVVFFSYSNVLDESCALIEDYLKPYCKDINGDGDVVINVVNCSYSKDSSDFAYTSARSSRLQAIIAAEANTMLFITDDETYDYLQGVDSNTTFFEGEKLYLSEDFYEKCKLSNQITLPEGLSISCRRFMGTMIEKDKNSKTYYEISQDILKGLKK